MDDRTTSGEPRDWTLYAIRAKFGSSRLVMENPEITQALFTREHASMVKGWFCDLARLHLDKCVREGLSGEDSCMMVFPQMMSDANRILPPSVVVKGLPRTKWGRGLASVMKAPGTITIVLDPLDTYDESTSCGKILWTPVGIALYGCYPIQNCCLQIIENTGKGNERRVIFDKRYAAMPVVGYLKAHEGAYDQSNGAKEGPPSNWPGSSINCPCCSSPLLAGFLICYYCHATMVFEDPSSKRDFSPIAGARLQDVVKSLNQIGEKEQPQENVGGGLAAGDPPQEGGGLATGTPQQQKPKWKSMFGNFKIEKVDPLMLSRMLIYEGRAYQKSLDTMVREYVRDQIWWLWKWLSNQITENLEEMKIDGVVPWFRHRKNFSPRRHDGWQARTHWPDVSECIASDIEMDIASRTIGAIEEYLEDTQSTGHHPLGVLSTPWRPLREPLWVWGHHEHRWVPLRWRIRDGDRNSEIDMTNRISDFVVSKYFGLNSAIILGNDAVERAKAIVYSWCPDREAYKSRKEQWKALQDDDELTQFRPKASQSSSSGKGKGKKGKGKKRG